MLGQEIVASYHLQQLHLGMVPVSLPNGFPPSVVAAAAAAGGAAAAGAGLVNGAAPCSPDSSSSGPLNTTAAHSPAHTHSQPLPHTPHPHPLPHALPPHPSNGASPDSSVQVQRIHNIARTESTNAQILDTAETSQRIREILSTHNIGQRLFAKHVLGLSQGTVSELLSKPKHWDKLTEKGRESYRKMYLWASDDHNVMALKAISPRKGQYLTIHFTLRNFHSISYT